MALMTFREPDYIKRRGCRPGHDGTQISKHNDANNGITIIHTVTAGKVFYLCTAIVSHYLIAAGGCYLYYRDAADLNPVYFFQEAVLAGSDGKARPFTFWPPIEIPADYDVCIRSTAAGLAVLAYIFGWEE